MDKLCLWKGFTRPKTKPQYNETGYFYHIVNNTMALISLTLEG